VIPLAAPVENTMPVVTTAGQLIRYAEVDGRTVAWTSVGTGPPLVLGGWWCSHLGLDWQDARFRQFVLELAEHHRVIRYDRPGSGLSDRDGPTPHSSSEEVAVLAGFIDAVGLDSPSLFGGSSGSVAAAGCAAAMPDRVRRLVLYGGYANGSEIASPAARAALVDVVRRHWGLGSRLLADVFVPGASADERADFARFQRQVASPEVAASELSLVYAHDATQLLAGVTAPTLVLHRRDDRAIPVALGRDLAARIAGARLIELDGAAHFPWLGNAAAVISSTLSFLAGRVLDADSGERRATPQLSDREVEVLRWVAHGETDAQIAQRLVLSPHTVHRHVSNIRTKLGVSSRAAAAAWAARHERL